MDISFLRDILDLTSLDQKEKDSYISEYSNLTSMCIFNILFNVLQTHTQTDLYERLKTLINDKLELFKSLDIGNEEKTKEIDQKFEQILLEIKDPMIQNDIKVNIAKKIEEIDVLMANKIMEALKEEDKKKIVDNLSKILK